MVDNAKTKRSRTHGSIDAEDRISALPDYLLQHILSFLPMFQVIATSLISRRWRHLWTSAPALDFDSTAFADKSKVAKFISLSLLLYEGPKVRKFRANLDTREVEVCVVDSWIRFAVRHNVEDLDIDFSDGYWADGSILYKDDMLYKMPRSLFSSCRSLKELTLACCEVNLPSSFYFQSLKKLHLHMVKINDLNTSGCPLLEDLTMSDCNSMGSLNIHAPNLKLRKMRIQDYPHVSDGGSQLVIYAPSLLFIEISGCGSMRHRYNINNLSSIISAKLEFSLQHIDDNFEPQRLMKLLHSVSHAKRLSLCRCCIQVLAFMEAQGFETPRLTAAFLEVENSLNKRDLPGLTCVLRNSSSLEALTLNICSEDRMDAWMLPPDYHSDKSKSWENLELALAVRLCIKTVKINYFLESKIISNSQAPITNIAQFLKKTKEEIMLVKIFLKRCIMLDKMILKTSRNHVLMRSVLKSELLLSVTKKILALPRASVNAEVLFIE